MKFKRMFSFFLSFAMLFSLFLPAYATQAESVDTEVQTHILRILASIEHEKEKYGLKDVNF